MPKTTTSTPAKTKKTMLGAVAKAAAAQRKATTDRDHLIAVAVKYGATQTEVAKAAAMSQAHVSRVVSYFKAQTEARNAQRRSKRAKQGEQL